MNLAHLLLRSARWLPDKPAIAVGQQPVLTYGELAARVSRLSALLQKRFKKGERIALAMKNCAEYYEVLWACWHAGLVAVPMNAKLHAKEFTYILEHSGAKLCFTTPDLESTVGSTLSVSSSEYKYMLKEEAAHPAETAPDDPCWVFYTSGTTGVPKGAMLTHRGRLCATLAYFSDSFKLGPGDS